MEITIAVRVPEDDVEALRVLRMELGSEDEIVTAHPFDGETVVQLLVVLVGASYPYFRSWLKSRATSRKSYTVVHDGTELTGYTAGEVESILNRLESAAPSLAQLESTDTKTAKKRPKR